MKKLYQKYNDCNNMIIIPILITLVGMIIDVRELHSENALRPNDEIMVR